MGEYDCPYCETKDSIELVDAEGYQSMYCDTCHSLEVSNEDGDVIDSSSLPDHLQRKLLN